MADYASQLYAMIGGVGDAFVDNRQQKMQRDRLEQQKTSEDRNYSRLLDRDQVGDSQWGQNYSLELDKLAIDRQNANRLAAASSRPDIGTYFDDEGRETRGYYDPSAPNGFRPVGGAKRMFPTVPSGYQMREDGGLEPVPGGPADPATILSNAGVRNEAKPPRALPNATVNDLGGKGAAVDDLGRLNRDFKDNFGGATAGWIGDVQNTIGRNFGAGYGDQAGWWQDYQSRKNTVRNNLFGSALTATEKGEFEKADINPGMTPEMIRTNLARQQSAATRAARKIATTYLRQGYSPEVIEGAIGIPLQSLGVLETPAEPSATAPSPPSAMPGGRGASGAAGMAGRGASPQAPPSPADIEAEMRRRGLR